MNNVTDCLLNFGFDANRWSTDTKEEQVGSHQRILEFGVVSMDGPEQQGNASSNKTATNSAPNVSGNSKNETSLFPLPSYWTQSVVHPSADSLSVFPKGLTEQKKTFVEASHHNLAPPKPNDRNDAFTESGSTVELDRFSKKLVDTEEEDEAPEKGGIDKQDIGELPKSGQKQMVSVNNLEEKRALDISNAKSRNNTSEAPSMRLFKFQLRECSNELQNPSSANNQSREPAANVSSILPRSEHHSSSTYRNDKLVNFAGGETENSKTECPSFVPPGVSLSTVRTRAISTGKPPLPPGAVTHLKGGVAPKGNKFHVHSMSQDSRKHIGVSEMVNENVIPAAQSCKEGCVEKGNSYSLYIRTDVAGTHGVLTAESGMLEKVASTDAVSLAEVVALSDDNQAGYSESSGQGKSLPQQEVLAFSNRSMKISVGSQGINESNRNIALRLDHKRKFFQLSKFSVAGKVHPQSSFEEEDRHIQQVTVGESLCSDDRAAQKVTKGSLQNRSGLLLTTSVSSSQGQEPCRSLPTSSDDQVPGNMVKYSNQNFVHFKSWKDDIVRHVSSATEKLKVSMQQTSSPAHFSQNIDEIQAQGSRASSATSSSTETTVVPSYRSRTDHCSPIQRSHIASRRIDYGSFNMAYLKGPVNIIQAERSKALQLPFKLAVKQGQHNVCENAEGYRHGSGSCGIDKEFGKVNVDRIQRQSHQIKSDVCMLGSQIEGTFVEAGQEVVLNSHDRNLSHSRTENQLQQNMMASQHGSRHPTLEYHPDVDPFAPQECCVDLTLARSERFKWTTCSDKKMLEPSCSEMVVESQGQNRQILDKCGESRGSKDPELVRLNHRLKIPKATQEPLSYKRLTSYQKDTCERHGGPMHVPNQGQVMTSHFRKHPYHINRQGSSSFVDTALNCTSMAQNTMGPTAHSSESRALQKTIAASGKGDSSKSHKKIDTASILSHPWIQRWRPSYQITSPLREMHCGSLSNKEMDPRNLPHLFAPMKMMPSAAAMAIVGIAARQLPPCQLQKKGSFSVWTAVRFTVNGTAE